MSEKKKHKVLVIDDEILIREVVKAALEHSDFEAVAVDSVKSAEAALKASKPDLVLLDIYMPEVNGLDLLRKLKAGPDTSKIPVIILSGSQELFDVLTVQYEGVYDYLTKPVDNRVLIAKIKKMLHLPADAR
jgi:DNA-binding response OmpR family regulator